MGRLLEDKDEKGRKGAPPKPTAESIAELGDDGANSLPDNAKCDSCDKMLGEKYFECNSCDTVRRICVDCEEKNEHDPTHLFIVKKRKQQTTQN